MRGCGCRESARKIKKFAIGFPCKQMTGEFEHIVRITGFARIVAQAVVELIRFAEVFIITVTPYYIGLVKSQNLPEEGGNFMIRCTFGKFKSPGSTYCFGNIGIGMLASHRID